MGSKTGSGRGIVVSADSMTDTDSFPAELTVLLACARKHMRQEDSDRAGAAIRTGVDWELLLKLSDAHGLLPLLHKHASSGAVRLPHETRERLGERSDANAGRSLALSVELVKLLRAFDAERIPVLPLKGPILAEIVYASVALRQMRDLDLLFRASDLARAARLIEDYGYRLEKRLPRKLAALAPEFGHHVSASAPAIGVCLELHFFLLVPHGRRRVDLDCVLPRLRRVPFMGVQVPALPAEDLFAYLCEHGGNHAWGRLEWLATVAELGRADLHGDWDAVRKAAVRLGGMRRLEAAVALAEMLIGPLDNEQLSRGDAWTRAANRSVVRSLTRNPLRIIPAPLQQFTYTFRTDAGATARLQRCWMTFAVPTPADLKCFSLPLRFWLLYCVLRPLRLLIRWLAGRSS